MLTEEVEHDPPHTIPPRVHLVLERCSPIEILGSDDGAHVRDGPGVGPYLVERRADLCPGGEVGEEHPQ
jgi:hypothetical protein